jgi:hypothetical protein
MKNKTEKTTMPKPLRLSLKTKWFEMTKAGIKTEDYREINEYWIRRLTYCSINLTEAKNELLQGGKELVKKYPSLLDIPDHCVSKKFAYNIVSLGYPRQGDSDRVLKLEHRGIFIRTGNPEWGAEPNKLYFVIMHGAIIKLEENIIKEGLKFTGKWFLGVIEAMLIDDINNDLVVNVTPTGGKTRTEFWNLRQTIWGFENGDYTVV